MRQYITTPVPPFPTADGSAYASSTTLTDVAPAPARLFGQNVLEVGTELEWVAFGRYSNTGTPTLTLGIYSGTVGQAIGSAVALCVTSALTTVSGVTNRTWRLEGSGVVRSIGTSGTLRGVVDVSNITTGGKDMGPATAPADATIDTTVARYITLGATWGTSSASNTLTVHHFGLRQVN